MTRALCASAAFCVIWMGLYPQPEGGGEALAGNDAEITVAVSYFENASGDSSLEPLKKGIAEMLTTDLAITGDVRVVERARLDDLLKEISLQKNPFFDESTAATLGKGLGATYLVVGSYSAASDKIILNARVIDVESSEVATAAKADGPMSDWPTIYSALSSKLLEGLVGKLSLVQQKKVGAVNSNNFDAFKHYSKSVNSLDEGDVDAARKAVDEALASDPRFKAAIAQKKKVAELSKAFDLNLHEEAISKIVEYEAGKPCPDSYDVPDGKFPDDWESLHEGTKLSKRVGGPHRMSASKHYGLVLETPVAAMTKVGMYAEARSVLDIYLTPEFLSATEGKGMPACMAYQFRSLLHYLQLEFEEAMSWQVKSTEIPLDSFGMAIFKDQCLSGMQWSMLFGLNGLSGPLKDRINQAVEGKDAKQVSARLDIARKMAPRVRAEIERRVKALDCAALKKANSGGPECEAMNACLDALAAKGSHYKTYSDAFRQYRDSERCKKFKGVVAEQVPGIKACK
jgi:TolB-like protein